MFLSRFIFLGHKLTCSVKNETKRKEYVLLTKMMSSVWKGSEGHNDVISMVGFKRSQ
jgi:hypothetical protein